MRNQAIAATVFVVIHHAIAIMHGDAHTNLPVILSPLQNSFIYLVIILLPVVAAVLMWTRFAGMGSSLLLLSMVAAAIFDIYHHYILVSPDNIAHLPAGPPELQAAFIWTANALTVVQLAGIGLAFYLFRKQHTLHEQHIA